MFTTFLKKKLNAYCDCFFLNMAKSEALIYPDNCVVCGKPASKKCTGCNLAFYCGRQHQRSHWPGHRGHCRLLKIENVDGSGPTLVAARKISSGTVVIGEYPVHIYDHIVDHNCASETLFKKLLICNEACPKKCPGCEEGWMRPGVISTCAKCGLPLCGKNCDRSLHSGQECMEIKKSNIFSDKVDTFSWRDVIIMRLLQQEKAKGCHISFKTPKWTQLLRKANFNHEKLLEQESSLPLSTTVGVANIVQLISTIMEMYSIQLTPRKRAIYDHFSLVEHSCCPAAEWWIDDIGFYFKLHVRLVRPLVPGERLSVNRFSNDDPSLILNPTLLRRQKMAPFSCQCERCLDPLEKGSCISGVRCSICKDSLNCNYYFPADPLDKRTSWRCSGKNCKAEKTFEQILCVVVKAERELERITLSTKTGNENLSETVISKYLDFIARHQRKILHPCHYLIMIARSRINKIVSYFLGSGVKLFLSVVTNQPRAYDYFTYKLDHLQSYQAFLNKLYISGGDRISGKILYEMGIGELASLLHDFNKEFLTGGGLFRRLHIIIDKLDRAHDTLEIFSDCRMLTDDIEKVQKMLKRMFGADLFSASYSRLKALENMEDHLLRGNVRKVMDNWSKSCDAIGFTKWYINPEAAKISKEDLNLILLDVPESAGNV